MLPVGNTAHDVEVPDELFPNAATRGKQKEALREYANRLKEKLRNTEGNTLTLAKATQFVKDLPGFEDTLEVQLCD